jgi:hypothetical protein
MSSSDAEVSGRKGPVSKAHLVPDIIVELLDLFLATFGKRAPSLANNAPALHPVRSVRDNPLAEDVHCAQQKGRDYVEPDVPARDRESSASQEASPCLKEDIAAWVFIRAGLRAVPSIFRKPKLRGNLVKIVYNSRMIS